MGLRLVDDDLDMSFDISMALETRRALCMQLQRAAGATAKTRFELRLSQQLQKLVDTDLRPPTARQIAYALSIAKTLDVALPGEALRHHGSMFDFLNRYVPMFNERREQGDSEGYP
jgi:hypothetical protein